MHCRRRYFSTSFYATLALVMAWVLGACKPVQISRPEYILQDLEKPQLWLVVDALEQPFRNYQVQLLQSLVKSRGGVDMMHSVADGVVELQVQHIEAAIEAEVDFMMVFPLPDSQVEAALEKAQNAGIKLWVLAPLQKPLQETSVIFHDTEAMGRLVGERIVSALQVKAQQEGGRIRKGRVVEFRGRDKSAYSEQLHAGLMQVLDATDDVELVHDAPGDWSEEGVDARVHEALRLQDPFDVVFCHNDIMARRVHLIGNAVEKREQWLVIGVDGIMGQIGGLQNLREGKLDLCLYRPPLVDVAWMEIEKVLQDAQYKSPAKIEVEAMALTADDVGAEASHLLPAPRLKK